MPTETSSFIVRLLQDTQTNTTRLQVMRVDEAREVYLTNNTLLLRVSIDKEGAIERCYCRHVASGREAYVQGGPGLTAFIKECLLEGARPVQPDEIGG